MNGVGIFKTTNTALPANKDINVVFSPYASIVNYTYQVYKDNTLIKEGTVIEPVNINLTETGGYKINVVGTLADGTSLAQTSDTYIIDKEEPAINVSSIDLEVKSIEDVLNNVSAYDNYDGSNLEIKTNFDDLNTETSAKQKLVYTVQDRAGNIATKEINVSFERNQTFMYAIYGIIVVILFVMTYMLSRYIKALKMEKRIEPFTLKPLKNKELSLSEKFISKYKTITKRLSRNFSKSAIGSKYSKKLDKYVPVSKIHDRGEEILAGKILTALMFVIISFILEIIKFKILDPSELVLIFTFGFFALDVLYFIKYKVYRRNIENDFISAVTIMNNAFKSGRSITQAIDMVAKELPGPIGREFNRMSLELLYGLEIEVVFKRFAKRIDLEEASYLTASLTILSKTGGDIIKVFNSIEKSMFDKRKLRLELASLTSGSKIVVYTLLGMPFLFAFTISLISPDYFSPFISTNIGRILLIFMLIYYIIFVVVVRKIMKVVI